MNQSDILDLVFIKIRDQYPEIISTSRLFTASSNPVEQSVTKSKIVLYLEPATSRITTLGAEGLACRRFERGGTVRCVVHTPAKQGGDILGIKIAEQLQALFEGVQSDPLHYDNVAVRTTGRDGNASWITTVAITYRLSVVK